MKKGLIITIAVLVIINVVMASVIVNEKKNNPHVNIDCVQIEEDAIAIGKTICQRVYPQFDYERCIWECYYHENEDAWVVFCRDKDLLDADILGGGLPEIHIRRKDAKILRINLMS